MRISEIYASKQGEGRLTGQPSVFVRTSGCNLRCDFCDTPFTSWEPEGSQMDVEEIVREVSGYSERHVVITGGEPMLAKGVVQLTEQLRRADFHITIETAGTLFEDVKCDLMSVSPKLSNSTPSIERAGEWSRRHESRRIQLDVLEALIGQYDYQLKFVVCVQKDVEEILELCEKVNPQPKKVLLMPEGTDQVTLESREQWVKDLCHHYDFSYCPRMHIKWYGNKRGT